MCYGCQRKGHYKNKCPVASSSNVMVENTQVKEEGTTAHNLAQFTLSFAQKGLSVANVIDPHWVILDTCSGSSVFCNKQLVTGVRDCAPHEVLTVLTNGGGKRFTKMGKCSFLPLSVHLNEDSMANIIAFKDMVNIPGARVILDTALGRVINVHLPQRQTLVFRECISGIHYYDAPS